MASGVSASAGSARAMTTRTAKLGGIIRAENTRSATLGFSMTCDCGAAIEDDSPLCLDCREALAEAMYDAWRDAGQEEENIPGPESVE